jgi:hypothetical protein
LNGWVGGGWVGGRAGGEQQAQSKGDAVPSDQTSLHSCGSVPLPRPPPLTCVVREPGVGLAEVVKHLDAAVVAPALQHTATHSWVSEIHMQSRGSNLEQGPMGRQSRAGSGVGNQLAASRQAACGSRRGGAQRSGVACLQDDGGGAVHLPSHVHRVLVEQAAAGGRAGTAGRQATAGKRVSSSCLIMADAAAPCLNLHAERRQATVSCQLSACRSSGFGPAWLVSYSPEACKHQHQAHDCHVLGQRPPAARQQAARGAAAAAALGWLGPLLGLLWLSSSGLLGRGVVCRRTGRRARGQADHTHTCISRLHRCVLGHCCRRR